MPESVYQALGLESENKNTGAVEPSSKIFQRNYVRPETLGGFGTPVVGAILQLYDSLGLTSEQLEQHAAMAKPLYRKARELYDGYSKSDDSTGAAIAQKNSLAEDLNSVMIKFSNWRKSQTGQELSPQERITQDFIDVRNPNSSF